MKILNISTVDLDKNGISRCILSYFEKISSDSVRIDVVAPNIVSKDIKDIIASKNAQLYELPFRKGNTLKYFFELIKIIRQGKYDIVHAHGNSCTLAIELLAAKIAGCRVRIAHSHNTTCTHQKAHKILRPVFEMSCTDRFACGEDAGKWLFENKKFDIIHNSVDVEKYKADCKIRNEMRKELRIDDTDILLGHVGAFNYQKNHEFLIELIKKLKNVHTERKYKLILIGDGENKDLIQQQVIDTGLSDVVKFTGNVTNVADYLQTMDLFLLPSRFEGLPYVLIEAQAAGLKCIVSDAVSRESDITGNVYFVELDYDKWINEIREKDMTKTENVSVDDRYNLVKNAEKLKKLYMSLYNERR